MAPAPAPTPAAPAPATAPAMDVEDEGGGGTKNQNNMVVVKSEAVCTDSGLLGAHPKLVKDEGGDTTECSSSFGDTCSGFEDEADDGESEVNSGMPAIGDGPSNPPRRKKVTDEWKKSVRPILWRCQWIELRMKELSSQVSRYDRELAQIKKQKDLQQRGEASGSIAESMQIHKSHGNITMKRRKRIRHEENVDTSLYINKHPILSYYHEKQNKGAETDGLLVDDDCGRTVDGGIRGGLDTATLLDSKDNDIVFEQLSLQEILSTIDGVQSQVHMLQDRLSNAHSERENLAFSEDNTHVRVARKRQHTQKRSFSYTKSRYAKPQKKKNLNILLKDDDGPALAGHILLKDDGPALPGHILLKDDGGPAIARRPTLPDTETDGHIKDANVNNEETSEECNHSEQKAITVDLLLLGTDPGLAGRPALADRETDAYIKDPNRNAEERSEECNCAGEKAITVDLLLGTDNSVRNGNSEDLCKENIDDILIDNQAANKGCQKFDEAKHLPSGTSSKGQNISNPAEVTNTTVKVDITCAPVKVVSTSAPALEQESFIEKSTSKKPVSPENKQDLKQKTRKKRKRSSLFTKKHRKVASNAPAAEEEPEGMALDATNKTGSTPSAATRPSTMAPCSAGRKRKSGNGPADMNLESGSSSSASKDQKTGKPSPATKKQKTENPSSAAKQETENVPSKLRVEKAVLVAVNSRRSQRIRKPKVFDE